MSGSLRHATTYINSAYPTLVGVRHVVYSGIGVLDHRPGLTVNKCSASTRTTHATDSDIYARHCGSRRNAPATSLNARFKNSRDGWSEVVDGDPTRGIASGSCRARDVDVHIDREASLVRQTYEGFQVFREGPLLVCVSTWKTKAALITHLDVSCTR